MPQRLRSVATIVLTILSIAAPAVAQTGRASGIVRDQGGKPIRSATVRADKPDAYPPKVTSTSDDRGRWAMIGLASGEWRFTVEAPGYVAQSAAVVVRSNGTPPMTFVLPRDPGPIPGALDKNIQQQIADANTLRDQGRLDQAISAYHEIRTKNQKLTGINFLLADAYRRKATLEADPTAKRALLQQAITTYDELLRADGANDRARSELAAAQAAAAAITGGTSR